MTISIIRTNNPPQGQQKDTLNSCLNCYGVFRNIVDFLPVDDTGALSLFREIHRSSDSPFIEYMNRHIQTELLKILYPLQPFTSEEFDQKTQEFALTTNNNIARIRDHYFPLLKNLSSSKKNRLLKKIRELVKTYNQDQISALFEIIILIKAIPNLSTSWDQIPPSSKEKIKELLGSSPNDLPHLYFHLFRKALLLDQAMQAAHRFDHTNPNSERFEVLFQIPPNFTSFIKPYLKHRTPGESFSPDELDELHLIKSSINQPHPNIEMCQSHRFCVIAPSQENNETLESKIDTIFQEHLQSYKRKESTFENLARFIEEPLAITLTITAFLSTWLASVGIAASFPIVYQRLQKMKLSEFLCRVGTLSTLGASSFLLFKALQVQVDFRIPRFCRSNQYYYRSKSAKMSSFLKNRQ